MVVGNVLKENDGIITKGMGDGSWIGKTADFTLPILEGATKLYIEGLLFLKPGVGHLFCTGPFKKNCPNQVTGCPAPMIAPLLWHCPPPSLFLPQTIFNWSLICPSSPITTRSHISWLTIPLSIQGHEAQAFFTAASLSKPHVLSPCTYILELPAATRQRAYLNSKETKT